MTIQRSLDLIVFHRSRTMQCPYIDGEEETQLFTELSGVDAQHSYDHLSRNGFRRSHHIAYRPACRNCHACVPVRVRADRFEVSRPWRRIMKRNDDLVVTEVGQRVTGEQYELFRRYVRSRHDDGDMARMTGRDYFDMVIASPVETTLFEFRTPEGALIAVCLADRMSDGYSAVYSFFDPDLTRRSLGSYVILWLVERARENGLPHVYLGFWIESSPKMTYKSRFRPIEGYGPDGWQDLETLARKPGA